MNAMVSISEILDIEPANRSEERVPDETEKKMVYLLIALGEPADAVARKMKLSKTVISKLVSAADGIEQIIRFQTASFPDPLARVKRLAHMALDAQTKILLRSTSDATIAKVANDILDRSTGKATQVIENRNLNVNITDSSAADRALKATEERLARLEQIEQKLLTASKK